MTRLKMWVALSTLLAALFVAFGSARVGHELGRREAIQRYREECVNADKKNERQFTLLYVDEYRASNCNEAIRNIWGGP